MALGFVAFEKWHDCSGCFVITKWKLHALNNELFNSVILPSV